MPSTALADGLVSLQRETAYRGCHVPYMQQGASGSAFPPEVFCQRVPTKQGNNRPRPFLGWACQSLWPSQLDDVYNGSLLLLTLRTQPSAYPDAISGVTPAPSRELASREGATLSERFAPGNYFPRTAPWLPVAEDRVGWLPLEKSSQGGPPNTTSDTANNCLYGLRRAMFTRH